MTKPYFLLLSSQTLYSLHIFVLFCCTTVGKDFEKVCFIIIEKNVVLEEESWLFPINVGTLKN